MREDWVIEESSVHGGHQWCCEEKSCVPQILIDYRRLSEQADLDAYPMPRIEELIDRLGGAQYLTTIDLARGYWQVPMEDKAKKLHL